MPSPLLLMFGNISSFTMLAVTIVLLLVLIIIITLGPYAHGIIDELAFRHNRRWQVKRHDANKWARDRFPR